MDNTTKQPKVHSFSLENRKKINMTGIEKVISSSETAFSLMTAAGGLTVAGKNLKINMFNVEDGSFAAEGDIDAIKYSTSKAPLLKRMFK